MNSGILMTLSLFANAVFIIIVALKSLVLLPMYIHTVVQIFNKEKKKKWQCLGKIINIAIEIQDFYII